MIHNLNHTYCTRMTSIIWLLVAFVLFLFCTSNRNPRWPPSQKFPHGLIQNVFSETPHCELFITVYGHFEIVCLLFFAKHDYNVVVHSWAGISMRKSLFNFFFRIHERPNDRFKRRDTKTIILKLIRHVD